MNIIKGSILDFQGDCIVNPANGHLNHAGGLARVIAQAATLTPRVDNLGLTMDGQFIIGGTAALKQARDRADAQIEAWCEDHEHAPLIAVGNAFATSPGRLPYKCVIHAVGPVYNGGHFLEGSLLLSAYTEALNVARERGCASIAFPAISCGIFGYPVEKAAPLAVRAVRDSDLDVSFYLMDDHHVTEFERARQTWEATS